MIRLFAALLLSMTFAFGCVSTPRIPGSGLGEKTKEIIGETQGTLWPFYFAGLFLILGGAAYGVFLPGKDFRFLFIGIGVAFLPPLFILFLAPIAIWIGWLVIAAGVMGLGFFGYKMYDHIKDEEAKRKHPDCPDHDEDK